MDKMDKIRKVWFGVESIKSPVLILPIPGIRKELLEIYKPKQELGGWYNPAVISIGAKDHLAIQVPVGRGVQDAVKALGSSDPVYLLGYCGGLNADLEIGDIVQDEDSHTKIPGIAKVKVQTVEGLLDDRYLRDYDIVDMENEIIKNNVRKYSSYFVVSDLPRTKPFFEVTLSDKKRVKESQTRLIKLLGDVL